MWKTVRETIDTYNEFMTSGDSRVSQWMFMEGPAQILCLITAYILFVKFIGPYLMLNKSPFDLRYTMLLYNMFIVASHVYFLPQAIKIISKGKNAIICREDNKTDPDSIRLAELGWWFLFFKFVELGDTIFFVLRKKDKHISNLHVFHHSIVPLITWLGLRFSPGGSTYFFPLVNSLVHTIMYSYYGLSALGPSFKKYLWWKKYLTTLQMVQFVMIFLYGILMIVLRCGSSTFMINSHFVFSLIFFVMFADFFKKTYGKKTINCKDA